MLRLICRVNDIIVVEKEKEPKMEIIWIERTP